MKRREFLKTVAAGVGVLSVVGARGQSAAPAKKPLRVALIGCGGQGVGNLLPQACAERVVALYGGYQPVPGMAINGRLTLGENISDMSGLPIAFDGLQIALQRSAAGKAQPLIDGYTPEQRFFLSNALVWRSKIRTEALINQLRTDSHSPAKYRVLAPMSNSPAFAQAFSCKADNAMVAADPIKVW